MNTIGTHNGSKFSQEHNRREYDEPHIDRNGFHESWIDIPVSEAYKAVFGMALLEYNEKQTHADRRIDDYYEHVRNKKNQHVAYEMIVGVYSDDGAVTEEQSREILKEFVRTWQERNPNLFLCGAYYHADEEGQAHVHIDYIPVAHDCKRGLRTQTNLTKALGEMGLKTAKGRGTAQQQMQRANNEYLEELCVSRGIEISHPGGKSLNKEAYIAEKEKTRLEADVASLEDRKNELVKSLNGLDGEIRKAEESLAERKKSADEEIENYRTLKQGEAQKEINALVVKKNALEREFEASVGILDGIVEKAVKAVPELEKQDTGINMTAYSENALEAKFEASTGMLERWSIMVDEQDEKLKKREADVAEREKAKASLEQSIEALNGRRKKLKDEVESLNDEKAIVKDFLDQNHDVRKAVEYEAEISGLRDKVSRLSNVLGRLARFIVELKGILKEFFPEAWRTINGDENARKHIDEAERIDEAKRKTIQKRQDRFAR